MQRKFVKRVCSVLYLIVMLTLSVILLTGCQSTDKSESYFDTAGIEYTQYEFDSVTNKTKVIWATTLTNNTIYDFSSFSVTFKLYSNSNLIGTETYNYSRGVKHGAEYIGKFNFYAENEIDAIEYVSWTANYDSFWETYKIWFIVMIVIVSVASLIYIIVMIIQDFNLDDIGEFLQEKWWILLSFLAPLAGTIWGLATLNWVPTLIIIGSIVALILICLLAHLTKFIIEYNVFFSFGGYKGDHREYFDTDIEEIAHYIGDSEKLMLFSVQQLKDYCRGNGIKGYSSLKKSNIIDLIMNSNNNEIVDDAEKNIKRATPKIGSYIKFDDIAGLEEAKNAFKEKVVYAFEHKELYEKYGKKVGGGILLYGLPGTGKTMFAEAASNETDALFIPIKCSDIKSKWYGESEANVKKIFEKARKAKKAIIFFDEFEAIGAKRTDDSDNGNNDLVPQILAEMQGIGANNSNSIIMVIAATNKPWAIDSAFLRPGRFDEKIYIPLPDFEARKKMFELKLKAVPQDALNYDYLANVTDGFNGADIGAFCDKLKMHAINKSIASTEECPITMNEVEQVQGTIKSSVSIEDVERLLEFRDQ